MLFTSKELAFAAGASSPNLFLNDIGRYNFRISAEKRIRGANYYKAHNLGKVSVSSSLPNLMARLQNGTSILDQLKTNCSYQINNSLAFSRLRPTYSLTPWLGTIGTTLPV